MIESGVFILMLAALVLSALLAPRAFVFLLGLTIPLIVPRLGVAVSVDWYKIVGPIAIALAVFRRRRSISVWDTGANWALVLIVYAVLVTSVWMYLEYEYLERYRLAVAMELGGGIAQNKLKMPVQLGSVVGQFLAVFAVPLWARDLKDCRAAILGVFTGTAISVAGGAIYWVVFGLATVNTTGNFGLLGYEDFSIPRLGGLSGEPKILGVVLVILLVYLIGQRLFQATISIGRTSWMVLGAFALFATFSSSAWSGMVVGGGVIVGLTLFQGGRKQLATVVVSLSGLVLLATSVGFVGDLIEMRIVNRLFGEGDLSQQKDIYIFRAFADHPFDIFFGYGLGGGDFAVIPYIEWVQLKYQRTPTPGVTGVRLLGDLGFLGLLTMGLLAIRWARRLSQSKDRAGASFMIGGLAGALLGSMIGLTVYYYIAGAILTAAVFRRREQMKLTQG